MASKVDICNIALVKVGSDTITSLTDNTRPAKLCNVLFDQVVDNVLSRGPWAAAVTRASLARTTNTPSYGFDYEYQLPTDPYCLQVLDVDEYAAGDNDFKIEGDKLLTDMTSVSIRYIGRVVDTQKFGPFLTEAVIAELVAELAYPLMGSAQSLKDFKLIAQDIIRTNLSIDGLQGSGDSVYSNDLLDVRDD